MVALVPSDVAVDVGDVWFKVAAASAMAQAVPSVDFKLVLFP